MPNLMGIDIGTTGAKATVFDEGGRIVSSSYKEYNLYHREPHLSELDPREVWDSIRYVIREAVRLSKVDPREIKALSVAVLGEAFLPIDRDGSPLYWSPTTFDARAVDRVRWWVENFGSKRMFEITGQPLSTKIPIYTLQRIEWIRENEPEIFERAWKFPCWEDYFIFRLTGECIIDHSVATRTMMFDIRKRRWSDEVLSVAKLDPDTLSDPLPSGRVVGSLKGDIAIDLGLSRDTLVVTGGHDQPCGSLGSGILEEGSVMDATGTVECYGAVQDRLVLEDEMRRDGFALHVYVVEGKYFMFGFTPTGGIVLRWLRDEISKEERDRAEMEGRDVYDIMIEGAMRGKGGGSGLFFYPYFEGSGTPCWDREVRGAIVGLTLSHTRLDLIRALMEGLAFELRMNLERMEGYGMRIDEVRAIGGGAKSKAWLQMKADITGKRVVVPEARMGTTSLGAAMLAASASIYKGIGEARREMCRIIEVYEPDPGSSKVYGDIYMEYKRMREHLLMAYGALDDTGTI